MSGELAPGESVRAELIAEMLGMSATPVREALKALRVEGFLTLQPRRGFQVADLTAQDIQDLFTVQALVAGELVARAARNCTPDDVADLQAIHADLAKAAAGGDTEALESLNHRFHKEINRLGRSPKILWVLGLLTRYVPRMFYGTIPGWPQSTIDGHGAILEAVVAGDPEAARAAMNAHLMKSGSLLASHFAERTRATAPAAEGPTVLNA
ncbi:GntR family transcriptional regulator [Phycicoccus endophyticus]|uniref:GntR family transcriptional regulator n=2 Tax=Phycicoccus endophyticus TaxID=1690220 RepID=A0A7G9R600_9MICO|nr:GntR family transcriptional regulator [Phycicoccus endophyticus]QNN51025.1 GntR family transcriptional regulator [Phycicoccus endophyticus]